MALSSFIKCLATELASHSSRSCLESCILFLPFSESNTNDFRLSSSDGFLIIYSNPSSRLSTCDMNWEEILSCAESSEGNSCSLPVNKEMTFCSVTDNCSALLICLRSLLFIRVTRSRMLCATALSSLEGIFNYFCKVTLIL